MDAKRIKEAIEHLESVRMDAKRIKEAIEHLESVQSGLYRLSDKWVKATNIKLKKRTGKITATITFKELNSEGTGFITERHEGITYDYDKLMNNNTGGKT